MRWCSRCAAGLASACFAGSGSAATACGSNRPLAAHPASTRSSAIEPATERHGASRLRFSCANACTPAPTSIALQNLDLLRMRGFDPRPAPLLDDPPDTDLAALQPGRRDPRRRKAALVALGNRDREIFRPAPAEIDEDGGSAFPDRQHLALDDREAAALGRDRRGLVRPHDAINRLRPHAQLGIARLAFARQKLAGAGPVADPRRHPSMAALEEIRLNPAFGTWCGNEQLNQQASVAVLRRAGRADPPQDGVAPDQRRREATAMPCTRTLQPGASATKPAQCGDTAANAAACAGAAPALRSCSITAHRHRAPAEYAAVAKA